MVSLRHCRLLLSGTALISALLFIEYQFLLNIATKESAAQLRILATYALNVLDGRLSLSLEKTATIVHRARADPSLFARKKIWPNEPFEGIGYIQRVTQKQRAQFERDMGQAIKSGPYSALTPASIQPFYYVLAAYLSDKKTGEFTLGFDLNYAAAWSKAFVNSSYSGFPQLLNYDEEGHESSELAILAVIKPAQQFLFSTLDKHSLSNITLPNNASSISLFRLLVWNRSEQGQPLLLLDTHPQFARPTTDPIAGISRKKGHSTFIFGAYPLVEQDENVVFHDDGIELMTFTLLLGAATLFLLWQQSRRNESAFTQIIDQNQVLEKRNEALNQRNLELANGERARLGIEARHRAILQASQDLVFLLDKKGLINDVNPTAQRLTGQSAEQLVNQAIGNILVEFKPPTLQHHFADYAVDFEGLPFETYLMHPDGSELPIELTLCRVNLPEGLFFLLVCRDISVRKQQEAEFIRQKNSLVEQVEMQSRQLSALLDVSPLAMAYIVNRQLQQVNHAFYELFECKEEQTLHQSTQQFYLNKEQFERTGRLLYHLLNAGQVVTVELQLKTSQGKCIWCRLYGKAINPAMPGLGTIWLYQNFSDERAAEDALRKAKEMAEDTSRAKTEFLANMSHELRTPMHAILGFAEMGASRALEYSQEKLQQYFQRIQTSGSRLLALLNDLLDLAKMEVGKMEYHFARTSLVRCLSEACDELSFLAEKHGIRLVLNAQAEEDLMADFDAFRIGQVIRNLLSNAIKFSPAGGAIEVSARLIRDRSPKHVEVSVADCGPGIPETELESIFDKFIQSSATKSGAGGTGLGLAICREIIHAHHGKIRSQNGESVGAIFSFTFPVEQGLPHHPVPTSSF